MFTYTFIKVITHFTKIRFKTKPVTNLYVQCAREICLAHPKNLPMLVKQVPTSILINLMWSSNASNLLCGYMSG